MISAKAIIPAGGLGTRFLPATKAMPKEMLPIVDKPAIQYIVEEGACSGLRDFVIVTGKNKNTIEDHFDTCPELDNFLKSKNKMDLVESIGKIVQACNFVYVRQKEPLGLGHAVWSAKHVVGKDHIAVFLPDDIIIGQTPCMQQLMQIAHQEKCSVVAVQEVPFEQVSNYGVVGIRKQFSPNMFQVKELVEKPAVSDAPSNLAIVGRYVLSPVIFDALDEQRIGAGGEVQLTDAIQTLLLGGEKVFAYKIQGMRYDIGQPSGFLQANIDLALRHSKYGTQMFEYLRQLDTEFLLMQGKADALSKSKNSFL
ncbi:MAG: UTP--glucose-1-phosphate uridylyltransferase GalU [Epsilonproteobacteria bacterium]|nr:UTP--glucose-1-phosphate uridylyltransferase GalU [Campylobacterota bacterium]